MTKQSSSLRLDELSRKKCQACHGEAQALPKEKSAEYSRSLPVWELATDGKSISHTFLMKDFAAAVRFLQDIAEVAEEEDHHPDIHLTGYRKLKIDLSTHAVGGLSENDFILAAKIEKLPKELKEIKK